MKKVFLIVLIFVTVGLVAQENVDLARELKTHTKKGDYIVLELRFNKRRINN